MICSIARQNARSFNNQSHTLRYFSWFFLLFPIDINFTGCRKHKSTDTFHKHRFSAAISTNQAMNSILWASSLLKKVKVHRWVFPVQKAIFALVNFAFSLVAVAIVMFWFHIAPTWHLIWLPICLFLLMVFCMGIGLALSALAVFFRDVIHLWGVVITAWTYFTPIFWTTDYIAAMPHVLRVLMYANPMYNYLTFMRDIFLFQCNPSSLVLGLCVVWAIVSLVAGYAIFHKTEHKFILYI